MGMGSHPIDGIDCAAAPVRESETIAAPKSKVTAIPGERMLFIVVHLSMSVSDFGAAMFALIAIRGIADRMSSFSQLPCICPVNRGCSGGLCGVLKLQCLI